MHHVFIAALFLFLQLPAHAASKSKIDKGSSQWTFDVSWKNRKGKSQKVTFKLPAKSMERDLNKRLQFNPGAMNHRIIEAINAYGKKTKGLSLRAKKVKGRIEIVDQKGSASKLKKAKSDLPKVVEKAKKTFMRRNGWTLLDGKIIPNHAAHAARYADDVLPLAKALGAETMSKRAFAERAIGFVQAIPYEIGKEGRDKGFRRPLSVLGRNKGDCDSKSTLFLALMKAAHPDLQSGFVYIKGHAYVGLGLQPSKKDVVFEADGRKWVVAEPVGPAMMAVGQAGPKSERKAKRGRIEFRRTKRPEGL